MSAHVYPFVFSFKSCKNETLTRCVLIQTTRTRKGDWVIRAKDNWDDSWTQVVNCSKRFKDLLDTHLTEEKVFEYDRGPLTHTRDFFKNHLGYTYNTFFWNVMRWSLVEAIREVYVRTLEEEVCALSPHFEKLLKAIPAPDEIVGKDRVLPDFINQSEAQVWGNEGKSYTFEYLKALEEALKPCKFKMLDCF